MDGRRETGRNPSRREICGRCAGRALGLALVLGFGLGAGANAQNLIVNGSFDSDVTGWSIAYHAPFIAIAWDALDAYDPTSSGFMQASSTIDNAGAGGPTQCVDVIGAPALWMSVDAVIFSQSFEYLYTNPFVRYYTGTGCTGSEIGSEFPIGTVAMGQGLKRISGPVVPPGWTQSILVDLGIVKPATAWPATVYFDNVHLPEPAEAVGGVAALLALAGLARRRDARA